MLGKVFGFPYICAYKRVRLSATIHEYGRDNSRRLTPASTRMEANKQ